MRGEIVKEKIEHCVIKKKFLEMNNLNLCTYIIAFFLNQGKHPFYSPD